MKPKTQNTLQINDKIFLVHALWEWGLHDPDLLFVCVFVVFGVASQTKTKNEKTKYVRSMSPGGAGLHDADLVVFRLFILLVSFETKKH